MSDLNKLALISPILFDQLMDRLVKAEGSSQPQHRPDDNLEGTVNDKAVHDMNAALQENYPPSTKVKLYQKALNDFRYQSDKIDQDVNQSPNNEPGGSNAQTRANFSEINTQTEAPSFSEINTQTESPSYLQAINAELTPAQQDKAETILQYLNKNDGKLQTDYKGNIYLDGQLIDDAKIDKIIVSAVRNQAKTELSDSVFEVFKVLANEGLPKSLIGNEILKAKLYPKKWVEK